MKEMTLAIPVMDRPAVEALLREIRFLDWMFQLKEEAGRLHLRVSFLAPCIVSGRLEVQRGRWWPLSPHMTRSEVVFTCWKACETAAMHEAREAFRYRGERIVGPHMDADALVALCRLSGTDARPARMVH